MYQTNIARAWGNSEGSGYYVQGTDLFPFRGLCSVTPLSQSSRGVSRRENQVVTPRIIDIPLTAQTRLLRNNILFPRSHLGIGDGVADVEVVVQAEGRVEGEIDQSLHQATRASSP